MIRLQIVAFVLSAGLVGVGCGGASPPADDPNSAGAVPSGDPSGTMEEGAGPGTTNGTGSGTDTAPGTGMGPGTGAGPSGAGPGGTGTSSGSGGH